MHAFWAATIIPALFFAALAYPRLRPRWIWLTGATVCFVYAIIFVSREFQGLTSGEALPDSLWKRLVIRYASATDLPLFQVLLGCLVNVAIGTVVWRKKSVVEENEASKLDAEKPAS